MAMAHPGNSSAWIPNGFHRHGGATTAATFDGGGGSSTSGGGNNNAQTQSDSASINDVPPSPTLTNPDMILPYDEERETSTPSPPFPLQSAVIRNHAFNNAPALSNYSRVLSYGEEQPDQSQIGIAMAMPARPPPPSRAKWSYEGHPRGRPLSDIGEEESQLSTSPDESGIFPAHEGTGSEVRDEPAHSRASSRSSSTISATSNQRRWNRRVDDDMEDRDSRRDSMVSRDSTESPRPSATTTLGSGPTNLEENSSTILSSEAERILENAKKRLSLMEGNLNRARTSIRLTPSPSLLSSSSSGSLHPSRSQQPAGLLYQSIAGTDRRNSSSRPRVVYGASQDSTSVYHSRVQSDTNLPLDSSPDQPVQQSRSRSALGSPNGVRFDRERTMSPADSSLRSKLGQYSKPEMSPRRVSGLRISNLEEFNSAYPSERPPSRAHSQLQVRELKDQAEGLKNKISMLKQKTQEENLRRRSLQSLRTPSPFSSAKAWYTSSMEYRTSGSDDSSSNLGQEWSPKSPNREHESHESHGSHESNAPSRDGTPHEPHEHSLDTAAERVSDHASDQIVNNGRDSNSEYSTADNSSGPAHEQHVEQDKNDTNDHDGEEGDDSKSVTESQYEDAEQYDDDSPIDREALNEILNEPLDDEDEEFEDFPPMAPEATPHEEREDAFDYENFYLHSALGSYTGGRLRSSSSSSTESNETTRPPRSPSGTSRHSHLRSSSRDSVSTAATFATATEHAYVSDAENVVEELDQALGWATGHTRRQSVESRATTTSSRTIKEKTWSGIRSNGRPASTEPLTPVNLMMSSFVPSVTPSSSSSRPLSGLLNDDAHVLELVFQSLGKVCARLQELTSPGIDGDPKEVRTLRRRLDAARRVLDGELDS